MKQDHEENATTAKVNTAKWIVEVKENELRCEKQLNIVWYSIHFENNNNNNNKTKETNCSY